MTNLTFADTGSCLIHPSRIGPSHGSCWSVAMRLVLRLVDATRVADCRAASRRAPSPGCIGRSPFGRSGAEGVLGTRRLWPWRSECGQGNCAVRAGAMPKAIVRTGLTPGRGAPHGHGTDVFLNGPSIVGAPLELSRA
jgi:hypothetical protein